MTWMEIRRRNETNSDEYKQCFVKIASMTEGPKRRVSIFLRSGLGLQDSRSYVQDFLKDTSGLMEDPRKSKKTTRPDRIWPEAWTQISKEQKEHILQNGQKKIPNCKQHGATEESTRYRPMTMITSRWLLMLVWNWTRILLLLCRALWGKTVEGSLKPVHLQLMLVRNRQIQIIQVHAENVRRKHMDHIAEKGHVGSFHYGLVHKPVSIQEALQKPEAKAAVDK